MDKSKKNLNLLDSVKKGRMISLALTLLTFLKPGLSFSFTSPDFISGTETFLFGSKATLECRTSEVPLQINLYFNDTMAANCLFKNCTINQAMEVFYAIQAYPAVGLISVHTDAVTSSFGFTTFKCEAGGKSKTIKPQIKYDQIRESSDAQRIRSRTAIFFGASCLGWLLT